MNQKLNVRKKKGVAIMTALLLVVSLLFVNMSVFSKEELKEELINVGALDTGTVACAGGGRLDCRGFAASVIVWIP